MSFTCLCLPWLCGKKWVGLTSDLRQEHTTGWKWQEPQMELLVLNLFNLNLNYLFNLVWTRVWFGCLVTKQWLQDFFTRPASRCNASPFVAMHLLQCGDHCIPPGSGGLPVRGIFVPLPWDKSLLAQWVYSVGKAAHTGMSGFMTARKCLLLPEHLLQWHKASKGSGHRISPISSGAFRNWMWAMLILDNLYTLFR